MVHGNLTKRLEIQAARFIWLWPTPKSHSYPSGHSNGENDQNRYISAAPRFHRPLDFRVICNSHAYNGNEEIPEIQQNSVFSCASPWEEICILPAFTASCSGCGSSLLLILAAHDQINTVYLTTIAIDRKRNRYRIDFHSFNRTVPTNCQFYYVYNWFWLHTHFCVYLSITV